MSNVNFIGTPKTLAVPPAHRDIKAYKEVKADEAAGGAQMTPAEWLEKATAYVEGVQNGTIQEDPSDPNYAPIWQYEQWIQQVSTQVFGTGSGGMNLPMGGDGTPAAASQPQCPPGAILTPDGNFCFDEKNADIIYDGNPTRSDVNSHNVRLGVNSMGAKYTFSEVPDPVTGESVLKLVIDGPHGQQTYVFNNAGDADFNLDIFAADPNAITPDMIPDAFKDKVKVRDVEDFNKSEEEQMPQASFSGNPLQPEKKDDGTFFYEALDTVGYIDFNPTSQGEGVPNETHEVEGNCNINLKPSDEATVTKAPAGSDYDYVITVKHSDETTDTFYVKKEWITNINGKTEHVTFDGFDNGGEELKAGSVPTELSGTFQVNGVAGAQECPFVPAAGDTAPNVISEDGKSVTYNQPQPVTVHAQHGDEADSHVITTTQSVDIYPESLSDKVDVKINEDGSATVVVTNPDGHSEMFCVSPGYSNLNIHGMPENTTASVGDVSYPNPAGASKDALNSRLENEGLADKIHFSDIEGQTAPAEDKAGPMLDALGSAAGKSPEQIRSALNSAGFGFADLDALKAAINDGSFPPAFSTSSGSDFEKLVKALYGLDATMSGALNSIKDTWEGNSAKTGIGQASTELVTLLSTLYPNHNISQTYPDKDWRSQDIITFDTTTFAYTTFAEGSSTFSGIGVSQAD